MVASPRNAQGIYPKSRSRFTKSPGKSKALPQFLEQAEAGALLRHAPHPQARLLMLLQRRAGLRVSETIAVTPADLTLEADQPTMRVRLGKGAKDRVVPVHPELREVLCNVVYYGAYDGLIIGFPATGGVPMGAAGLDRGGRKSAQSPVANGSGPTPSATVSLAMCRPTVCHLTNCRSGWSMNLCQLPRSACRWPPDSGGRMVGIP